MLQPLGRWPPWARLRPRARIIIEFPSRRQRDKWEFSAFPSGYFWPYILHWDSLSVLRNKCTGIVSIDWFFLYCTRNNLKIWVPYPWIKQKWNMQCWSTTLQGFFNTHKIRLDLQDYIGRWFIPEWTVTGLNKQLEYDLVTPHPGESRCPTHKSCSCF